MLKKVLAGVLACTMMSSAFTAMAANTVEVTSISVLEDNDVVATFAPNADNIRLTPEQMLEVTVKVTGDESDDVYASFLSNKTEGELSNSTVQYVAQKAVGKDNTATFNFRPRESVGKGSFTAKSGATGATTAATFSYLVKEADKAMKLEAKTNKIKLHLNSDAVFKITADSITETSAFDVYLDNVKLDAEKYRITKDNDDILLTVKNANFTDKTAGTKLTVKVTLDGYTEATGEISIIESAKYDITYMVLGSVDSIDCYYEEEGKTLPETVTREHYTFDGWYENAYFSGEKVTVISADATGPKTFYAKMIGEKCNVKLETNGGTITDGKDITSYEYGTTVTLPTENDISNGELHFAGWYDNAELNGDPISTITSTAFDKENGITYYAKWSEIKPTAYLITFVDYDGKTIQSGMVNEGETPTCDAPTRASDDKYDYTFDKWEPEIVPVAGTATYTAVYTNTPRTYQITYNLDGEEFTETTVLSYTYSDENDVTLPIPQREDYTFDGWYDNADCTGTAIKIIAKGSTGEKEFYAKWIKDNKAEAVTVRDAFKDTVEVTRLVDTNTTITVSAKEGQTIPELKMYRATYTADNVLKNVEEISANTLNENLVFTFSPLTLNDGETSKVMLWSDNNPVINAIAD